VVRFVARLGAANLPEPSTLATDPREAVTQFCLRYAYWSGFPDAIGLQRIVIALAPRLPKYAQLLYTETYAPAEAHLAAYIATHFPAAWEPWGTPAVFAQALMNAVTPNRLFVLLGTTTPYPVPPDLEGNEPHTRLPDEAQIRHTLALFLEGNAPP